MRLIYLGTPQFAVPTLEAILRAGHEVLSVVTQPDRPKGRGRELASSPVKQCALSHHLPVFQPQRIRHPEAQAHLRDLAPEIMVVVGYGQIIPKSVIDIAPRGIVNVHASLLPHLRGAAPIQWAIANGDTVTGVTTMQIDVGLDTGAMLLKISTPIGEDENAIELSKRLAQFGAELLIETLARHDSITPEPQDNALATLAPILKKSDGWIDFTKPAHAIHNLVRGMQPWPGAHTRFRGSLLHIWSSRLIVPEPLAAPEFAPLEPAPPQPTAPGALAFDRHGLRVCCGDGLWLQLIEVQMEGRRRMTAEDFARGQRVEHLEKLGD